MRRQLLVALAALSLVPCTARAQQTPGTFGLGLGLQNLNIIIDEDFALIAGVSPQVYVPIVIGEGMMLEPGIGYFRVTEETESDFGDESFTFSALRLGAGLLFFVSPADRGRIYAGPRAGILRISSEAEFDGEDDDESRTDLILSGALGGEFFLLPAFSLGGEASLDYLRLGDSEDEDEPDGFERKASRLSLGTELRVRWYIR